MEVYGEGLRQVVEIARESGDGLLERLVDDRLVASLLLVHGLHPVDAETRIRRALAPIERRLDGQRLVFEGLDEGVARVRIEPGGPPAASLAAHIEEAVAEAAPEVEQVDVLGAVPALVQIAPTVRA